MLTLSSETAFNFSSDMGHQSSGVALQSPYCGIYCVLRHKGYRFQEMSPKCSFEVLLSSLQPKPF